MENVRKQIVVWGKESRSYGSIMQGNADKSKKIWNIHERHGTKRLVSRGDHKMDDRNRRWPKIC